MKITNTTIGWLMAILMTIMGYYCLYLSIYYPSKDDLVTALTFVYGVFTLIVTVIGFVVFIINLVDGTIQFEINISLPRIFPSKAERQYKKALKHKKDELYLQIAKAEDHQLPQLLKELETLEEHLRKPNYN